MSLHVGAVPFRSTEWPHMLVPTLASPVVGIGVQLHFNFQFFLIASQWQGHTGSYQTVAEYLQGV